MSVAFSPERPSRLKKDPGILPAGVHPLLDVDRQREEIDVAEATGGRGGEDHRVALADDYGTGGLLGHAAGLERDLTAGDLHGDPGYGVTAHVVAAFLSARRSAARFALILYASEPRQLSEPPGPRPTGAEPPARRRSRASSGGPGCRRPSTTSVGVAAIPARIAART